MKNKGQAILEYFILLAVFAAFTIVGANLFIGSTRDTQANGLFTSISNRIINAK